MRLIVKFWKDESAATAIEYGLIATGIAVAVIPVITGLGTRLRTTFSTVLQRSNKSAATAQKRVGGDLLLHSPKSDNTTCGRDPPHTRMTILPKCAPEAMCW